MKRVRNLTYLFVLFPLFSSFVEGSPNGLRAKRNSGHNLFDSTQSLPHTTSEDIQLVDINSASCILTLQAHSNRILRGVRDTSAVMTKFHSDLSEEDRFHREVNFETNKLASRGCSSNSTKVTIHSELDQLRNTPTSIYIFIDVPPPQSDIPVLVGRVGRNCRIVARNSPKEVFLKHVEVVPVRPHNLDDREEDSNLAELGFGSREIVLDVDDVALMDLYVMVSCEGKERLGSGYVTLRSGISVGSVRQILEESGAEADTARSFMVAGFRSSFF